MQPSGNVNLQFLIDTIFDIDANIFSLIHPSPPSIVKTKNIAKQTKEKQSQMAMNILFDEYDSELTEQLSIFQLRFLLEGGKLPLDTTKKMYLTEEHLRELLGTMFLENSSYVNRKEFRKFFQFFQQKLTSNTSIIKKFSLKTIDKKNINSWSHFIHDVITRFDVIHEQRLTIEGIVNPSIELDGYHSLLLEQFFQQTSTLQCTKPINYIENNERKQHSQLTTEYIKYNRRKELNCLFGLYCPTIQFNVPTPITLQKKTTISFVFDVNDIVFDIGYIPSLFISFSLYDRKNFEKVSSNFVVTNKQKRMEDFVHGVSESCVVSLTEEQITSGNICAVIQLYKLFNGETTMKECLSGIKDVKSTNKMKERIKHTQTLQKKKNVKYFQWLAAGAVPLHKDFTLDRKSYYNLKMTCDDDNDIWQLINNLEQNKCRILKGSWGFKFERLMHYTATNLIVTLDGIVQNLEAQPVDTTSHINEEIPMDYHNTLFIYPTELIQIIQNNHKKVKAFYSQIGTSGTLCESYITSVCSEKQIIFTDEIRVHLPFPLQKQHHILFTICAISIDDYSMKELYHIALQLYPNQAIIASNQYYLGIIKNGLNEGYLHQELYDQTKMSLKLRVNVQSTVYSKNKQIHSFLVGQTPIGLLRGLPTIPSLELLHFLPSIVNHYIFDLNKTSDFLSICCVFEKIAEIDQSTSSNNQHHSNTLLDFVTHMTLTKPNIVLTTIVRMFFIEINETCGYLKSVFMFSWVLFKLIYKSLVVLKQNGEEIEQKTMVQLGICCSKYSSVLRSCVVKNKYKGIQEGNQSLAEFCGELMGIYDKENITQIIIKHLQILNSSLDSSEVTPLKKTSNEFIMLGILRIEFIRIIMESKQFIAFNCPQQLHISSIGKLNDNITEHYLLATYCIRNLLQLLFRDGDLASLAINVLMVLVCRFDFDGRYQEYQAKEIISSIFFEIITFIIDEYEFFKQWHYSQSGIDQQKISDLKALYLCMFFILKNMSHNTLDEWVRNEIPTRIEVLLIHIRRAILLFSNFGELNVNDPNEQIQTILQRLLMQILPSTNVSPSILTHASSAELKKSHSVRQKRPSDALNFNEIKHSKELVIKKPPLVRKNISFELTEELGIITMDIAEALFDRFENGIDGGNSLNRLENIVSTTLFEIPQTESYTTTLHSFIQVILLQHRHFVFEGAKSFGGILLKNLLKMCASNEDVLSTNALPLLFNFIKNNFIFSYNVQRSLSDASVALSEIDYSNISSFRDLIKKLPTLYQDDIKKEEQLLNEARQKYWEDGQKNIQNFIHLQQLNSAEEISSLIVFITFVHNVVISINSFIEFLNELHGLPINGYSVLKKQMLNQIIAVLPTTNDDLNSLFNIVNASGIKRAIDIVIHCQVQHKELLTHINKMYINVEKEIIADQSIALIIEELDTFFNTLPQWIGTILNKDHLNENDIKERKNYLENIILKLQQCSSVIAIDTNKINEILNDVIKLCDTLSNAKNNENERIQSFESEINQINSKIINDIDFVSNEYTRLINILNTTQNFTRVEGIVRELDGLCDYNDTLESKIIKRVKDVNNVADSYCQMQWWITAIEDALELCKILKQVGDDYWKAREEMKRKEQWFHDVVSYITVTGNSYLYGILIKEIIETPNINESSYVVFLAQIAEKLTQHVDDIKQNINSANELYDKLTLNTNTTTRQRRRQRTYSVATAEVVRRAHIFHITASDFMNKSKNLLKISKQLNESTIIFKQNEEACKEYANTLNYLFTASEQFIRAPNTISQAVIKDVVTLEQRLNVLENLQNSTYNLNRYVNYTICNEPHQVRVRKLETLYTNKLLPPQKKKSTATPKKKGVVSIKKQNFLHQTHFITNDGKFSEDTFIDISKIEQTSFNKNLIELTTSLDKILIKLVEIQQLNQTSSSEILMEKYFVFANEYQNTQRVHVAWIQRMKQVNLSQNNYTEAALCCCHIVLYIGLPQTIDISPLYQIYDQPPRVNNEIFNNDVITSDNDNEKLSNGFSQLQEAIKYLLLDKQYFMALKCYEVLISLFKYTSKPTELSECHQQIKNIYENIGFDIEKDYYYYCTQTKNSSKSFIYRSTQPLDIFTQNMKSCSKHYKIQQVYPLHNNKLSHYIMRTNIFCLLHDINLPDDLLHMSQKRLIIRVTTTLPTLLEKADVIHTSNKTVGSIDLIIEKIDLLMNEIIHAKNSRSCKFEMIYTLMYPFNKHSLLDILEEYVSKPIQNMNGIHPNSIILNMLQNAKDLIKDSIDFFYGKISQNQEEKMSSLIILVNKLSTKIDELLLLCHL
ncbi:DOCKER domain-containing protein [Entamoeba marina]